MGTEELVVFFICDDFNEAVRLSHNACFAVGRQGEGADFDVVATFLGFAFGEANARDFGAAVGAVGVVLVIDGAWVFACDELCDHDTLVAAGVGELGCGDNIADGVDILHVGAAVFVDGDKAAFVGLDADFIEPDVFGDRCASNGNKQHVCFELGRVSAVGWLHVHAHAVLGEFHLFDGGGGFDVNLASLERFFEFFRDIVVLDGEETILELHQGDFGTEGAVNRRKFGTDGACAHDDQALGYLRDFQNIIGVHGAFVVHFDEWQVFAHGTRRQDDVFGGVIFGFAFGVGHAEGTFAGNAAVALQDVDLVFLHQKTDAAAVGFHDLVAVLLYRVKIEFHAGGFDAELFGSERAFINARAFEERFGRNTATQGACTAEVFVLLDNRGF